MRANHGSYFVTMYMKTETTRGKVLWQPLVKRPMITQISKSLKLDIVWEVHKRTQQGVSAKLESFLYKTCLVHTINN